MTINNIKKPDPLEAEVTLTLTGREVVTLIAGLGETSSCARLNAVHEYFPDNEIGSLENLDFYRSLLDVAESMGFKYKG